jgi:predicted ATPase
MSHATIAFVHWYLGYPDQMLANVKASIALAEQLGHPFSLAAALGFAGFAHQFRGEAPATKRRATEVIALCRAQNFPLWIPLATCLLGWLSAEEGETAAGIDQLQQGLEAPRTTETELLHPRCLALLAEAYGRAGQAELALQKVAEALTAVETSGERSHEAELHRLQGELLLQGDDEAAAEVCYRQAIQVAQQQSAKAWELRATMSLCRLWQSQNKSVEAQQYLAAIIGWFSEGFDTADLIAARALLTKLG